MRANKSTGFCVPASVEEALRLLAQTPGRTTIVGGGTHVMPMLLAEPDEARLVIDIATLPRLRSVRTGADGIDIGPAVTYAMLLDRAQARVPRLLRLISGGITGGPQIRNQGTIGGSACYANPASDIPTGLVALSASFVVASRARGERVVSAQRFFKGAFAADLAPDELLVDILLPYDAAGDRWAYVKLKSAESSWPIATAAARVREDAQGASTLTLTIGAACETPISLGPVDIAAAGEIGATERLRIIELVEQSAARWWTDALADARYRRRVAGSVAVRAAEAALKDERADHG